jgi:hypothetical protein
MLGRLTSATERSIQKFFPPAHTEIPFGIASRKAQISDRHHNALQRGRGRHPSRR